MAKKKSGSGAALKASALAVPIPDGRDTASEFIAVIGAAQRDRVRIETRMNDLLARLKARYEEKAALKSVVIKSYMAGLQTWCEVNRKTLLEGDSKTARFKDGEVQWRKRPKKVTLRNIEEALKALKEKELTRFIRTVEEINKEAILEDPDAVEGVKGISVGSEGENFIVKPFETGLEEVV